MPYYARSVRRPKRNLAYEHFKLFYVRLMATGKTEKIRETASRRLAQLEQQRDMAAKKE